jgi:hypothetical protein
MINCEVGDLVAYSTIALAGYDIVPQWASEEAIGVIIKKFHFGNDEKLRKCFEGNNPSIQFPKFVYTLLSFGEAIEVLDMDIVKKIQ